MVTVPELHTERLVLRGWRHADLRPFAALNADPEVMAQFPNPLTETASDRLVRAIIDGWEAHGFGLWAVERAADGAFLGFTGLSRPTFDAPFMPVVEIGWRFARFAWGNGYATEAAQAALAFGFGTLELDEIVSFTATTNVRSRRVMERLGMTYDPADDFDHPRLPPGSPLRRHVLYRLRRADWGWHEPGRGRSGQARSSGPSSSIDAQPSNGSASSSSARRMEAACSTPARPAAASAQ